MAIYHLDMKAISRSAGRSATGAAAYRAGCSITDQRTGEVHDYRRKGKRGVESANLVLPDGVPVMSREDLWNGVELHHRRGDALIAREFEVALPAELSEAERRRLAVDFAREVANHYGVAADVCIHKPGRGGDERNHHAHILISACGVTKEGFGKKVVGLDPIHCQRHKIANPAALWRERWADLTNERLQQNKIDARVDHRSLKDQGSERQPTKHLGPSATGFERRTGEASHKRRTHETQAKKKLAEKGYQERVEQSRQAAEEHAAHLAGELAIAKSRNAEWEERNARRHAGTPNRIIRMDQTTTNDGRVLHRWGGAGPSAGKVAVIEKGNRLSAAGKYSRPKAAAMAQVAQARGWKAVTITGNEEFKAMALREFLRRGIEVSNPELQQQVQAWHLDQAKGAEVRKQAEEAKKRAAEVQRAKVEAKARQGAEERARRAQEAQAAMAMTEGAKLKEEALSAPPIDHREALKAEVMRLIGNSATFEERADISSFGTVFAVNERYAAQDIGRRTVRIIDRTKSPVTLGTWSVQKNGSIKPERLKDGGRGLIPIYGKGVTEQLERAAPQLGLGPGKGMER